MADLRFSGGSHDRRRRMRAGDFDSSGDFEFEEAVLHGSTDSGAAAFPLLSRDRLIRRVISPRLWKHVILTSLLLLMPLTVAFARMTSGGMAASETQSEGFVAILRGLAGLELFLAAQICLLICWVRGASAVDFRGGYRTWRWMSMLLLFASLMLVTGAWFAVTDLMAEWLVPVIGPIEASRPALLFVPFGAMTAFVLQSLIPDMGRCRPAQILAIAAAVIAVGRAVSGLRGSLSSWEEGLAILELLTCGLVLSATELYCRYVIHVNPNPPVVTGHSRGLLKPGSVPGETDGSRRTMPSESVIVSVRGESEPVSASSPPMEPAAQPSASPQSASVPVEHVETPVSAPNADRGNKASRKKNRRAA